jgi:hypothetical protein
MAILLGNGDGTFRHNKSGTIVQRGARPFATVDYDGDGNLDLYSAGERPPLGGYSWAMATEHLSSRELRSEVFTRRSVILMEMGRWIWQ